mmetsp:Transcript_28366/g.74493  ORF Transcript_28366/g.74493 Transcript_28366/m.74493 type:complete len:506 (+) Transcript_28366:229-1746(+)
MGRITIFSLPSCGHCKKTKEKFTDLGWDFADISIGHYPEKRADMLKVADRLTVPQVFFNDKHIGGASEVEALLADTDDLDALYASVLAEPGPALPELAVPDYPPRAAEAASARQEEEICVVGGRCMSYNDMVVALEKGLAIKDRSFHGKIYKRVFVGSEFVSWVVAEYGLQSRVEGVQVGQSLVSLGLFAHVSNDHNLEDAHFFYRLHSHGDAFILNTRRKWIDRVDKPHVIVQACKKRLDAIQSRATKEGEVDYIAMADDAEWPAFDEATCEIQKVTLSDMADDERLAFIINVYNLAIVHAMVKVGIPKTNLKRYTYFDKVGYCIGDLVYSFNDLENGILRGNKVPPYHLRKPFSGKDPRLASVLPRGEYRIHAALNCGAKSCPPIKFFTPEAVQEELRLVAMAFAELEENVRLDEEKRVLWLSSIVSWYASDFGGSKREIAATIASMLRGDRKAVLEQWLAESDEKRVAFKIRHLPYDWGTNASRSKDYSPGDSKNTASCIVM